MGTPADHIVAAGHAPTPFTAEEIRAASPRGHTTRVLIERRGEPPTLRETTFEDVTPTHASMRFVERAPDSPADGDGATASAQWKDLQAHASYPVETVVIADEVIDLPIGEVECVRYTVSDGHETTIHWFAKAHPGMPVRTHVWNGSDLVYTATVLAIEER